MLQSQFISDVVSVPECLFQNFLNKNSIPALAQMLICVGFVAGERGRRELVVYEYVGVRGFCYGRLCCGLRMRRSSAAWRRASAERKLK